MARGSRGAAADAPAANFYERTTDEATALAEAREVEGVDDELALLRKQLRTHVRKHPEDFELMLKGAALIVRAAHARYRMSPRKAADLGESMTAALAQLGDSLFGDRDEDV